MQSGTPPTQFLVDDHERGYRVVDQRTVTLFSADTKFEKDKLGSYFILILISYHAFVVHELKYMRTEIK